MSCERDILGIHWYDFIRNSEVVATTNLPSIQNIISRRRDSLFGHVVHPFILFISPARRSHTSTSHVKHYWQSQHDLTHILSTPTGAEVQAALGIHGYNRSATAQGTPFSIRAEWPRARSRGHSGMSQRSSRDSVIMMMHRPKCTLANAV